MLLEQADLCIPHHKVCRSSGLLMSAGLIHVVRSATRCHGMQTVLLTSTLFNGRCHSVELLVYQQTWLDVFALLKWSYYKNIVQQRFSYLCCCRILVQWRQLSTLKTPTIFFCISFKTHLAFVKEQRCTYLWRWATAVVIAYWSECSQDLKLQSTLQEHRQTCILAAPQWCQYPRAQRLSFSCLLQCVSVCQHHSPPAMIGNTLMMIRK